MIHFTLVSLLLLFSACPGSSDALNLNDSQGLRAHPGSTCTSTDQCVDSKLAIQSSDASISHMRNGTNLATRAAADSSSNSTNGTDIQSSLTLDPSVFATGFEDDGLSFAVPGQSASLTSSNNFINFCATLPNLPITNGSQQISGSCNPAPMGAYPSSGNMPSAKFVFPTNGATLIANQTFTISLAVNNLATGSFVNPHANYHAAPQQLDGSGRIQGHSHVVIDRLSALDQVTPTDPTLFAFFSALNAPAVDGVLSVNVSDGLPAGFYRIASLHSATNHQPVLVPIAQHGALDDAVHFSVTFDGKASGASQPSRPDLTSIFPIFILLGLIAL